VAACFCAGYVIATIAAVVSGDDISSRMYAQKMDEITAYMAEKDVPQSLAFR
jgi:hypothetical protein